MTNSRHQPKYHISKVELNLIDDVLVVWWSIIYNIQEYLHHFWTSSEHDYRLLLLRYIWQKKYERRFSTFYEKEGTSIAVPNKITNKDEAADSIDEEIEKRLSQISDQTNKKTEEQEKRIQEASKRIIELEAIMKATLNNMHTTRLDCKKLRRNILN